MNDYTQNWFNEDCCCDCHEKQSHVHEVQGSVRDRHVHFLASVTEVKEGRFHEFRVATLIDDPIGKEA